MIFLLITHSDTRVSEHFKHKLQSAFEGGTPVAESEQLFSRSTSGHLKLKTFTFLTTKGSFNKKQLCITQSPTGYRKRTAQILRAMHFYDLLM